ncbi:Kinetochore-associated protein 1 [Hondaea fermentalgiana]|uniref:Kinetochore-associated protein 1 n=1 Tax=Hondaea fermentalgiana TaxID=2315210 RepID=A0A2R5GDZ6_9STRA|nr:Kinetochore-associated protein 1 [Hondaea fermentalgiana]|eukprot:GBG29157.1 Kinetochore-associated protein 1 [Hondaea fermentalgiana]
MAQTGMDRDLFALATVVEVDLVAAGKQTEVGDASTAKRQSQESDAENDATAGNLGAEQGLSQSGNEKLPQQGSIVYAAAQASGHSEDDEHDDGTVQPGTMMCLGAGKDLRLLELDAKMGPAIERARFSLSADVLAWNSSGTCFCVGDARGTLHFISDRGSLLFSQPMLGTRGQRFDCMTFLEQPSFFDSEQVGEELFIASRNPARLFRFSNLCLHLLEDAAEGGNTALLKSVRDSASMQSFELDPSCAAGGSMGMLVARNEATGFLRVLLAARDAPQLSVWVSVDSRSPLRCDSVGGDPLDSTSPFCALENTASQTMAVTLSQSGRVCLWDARRATLLRCLCVSPGIVDIACMGTGARLGILRADGTLQVARIRLHGSTTLETLYESRVRDEDEASDTASRLVAIPGSRSFAIRQQSTGGVKGIVCFESNDAMRFESLLSGGRFDEALALATQHDLPGRDRAFKGKLSQLLETARSHLLDGEGISDLPETIYEKFFGVVDELIAMDPQRFLGFVVQGCMQVRLPGAPAAQKRLLRKAEDLCSDHAHEALLAQVKDALYRLETYTLLSDAFDCEEWQRFRTCRLMQALTLFLQKGQLQMGAIVLHRHIRAEEDDVVRLLAYIPAETSSEVLVDWLRDHVGPHVRSHGQKAQLASWSVFMASKTLDAVSALSLIQEAAMIASAQVQTEREKLKLRLCSPGELARQAAESGPRAENHAIAELERLRADLVEVIHLQREHALAISVEAFRSASRVEVLMDMMSRVTAPELIARATKDHLRPCAARYGVDADEVLVRYISRVALEIDSSSSAWEQCAVKAVGQIGDLTAASRAVLTLMRNIVPPYSDELSAVVETAMTWTTDLQGEILDQKRLMDLSSLLSSFQLDRQINFGSATQAKAILMYVLAQSETVAERAVQIARAYRCFDVADVFATLFENMTLQSEPPSEEKVRELHSLMVELCPDVVVSVEERVRNFCMWGLAEESDAESDEERLALARLGAMVGACGGHAWSAGFEAARDLQTEFSIRLDLQDFSLDGDAEGLLELHVMRESTNSKTTELGRRASLLGFSREQMAGRVAIWLARQEPKNLDACLAWGARPMSQYWKQRLAVELAMRFPSSSRAQRAGHDLLVDVCLNTKDDAQICRATTLLRSSSLVQAVLDRCGDGFEWDASEDAAVPTRSLARAAHAWFKEHGTVLESTAVLPLLAGFLYALGARQNPEPAAEALMGHLSQNGALQLGLRVVGIAVRPGLTETAMKLVRGLADKVLSAPHMDADLALGYLLADAQGSSAFASFRSSLPKNDRGDFARLQKLAGVGISLGRCRHMQDVVLDCQRMQENARWWTWLQSLNVDFDPTRFTAEGAKANVYLQQTLLQLCIPRSGYDLEKTVAFAETYKVRNDLVHGLYLKLLFLDETADLNKHRDEIALARCRMDDSLLLQVCEHVFPRVPGTSYERLEAVCRLCAWPGQAKYLQVLELLRICEVRLNLHALFEENPWPALELCLEPDTVKWLVALSDPLDLDPNDFYLCLVRKLMRAGESVTKSVLPVLNNVKSHGRVLEACSWLVGQVGTPEAKLLILRFALERAESDEMTRLANQLATELDLRRAGIAARLPSKKADLDYGKLIADLYDRFGPVAATQWQDRHRLHQVAEQLAHRHGVDLLEVRKRLVLGWLATTSTSSSSTTTTSSASARLQEAQQVEEELLQRIVYTMSARPGPDADRDTCRGIAYLLNFAFQTDVPGRSFASRARALRAVFRLGSSAQIDSVYSQRGADALPLDLHLQYCIYMSVFEDLHLPHTFDQLVQCDKRGLVRGLWRDHRGDERAVQLVAHLMLDFDLLDEPKIVQALLRQMLSLGMRREFFFTTQQILQRRVEIADLPELFAQAHKASAQEDAEDAALQQLITALVRSHPGLLAQQR